MPVGNGDEACRHEIAKERNAGGMAAIGDRERAIGVIRILGIGQRRVSAEGDRGEVGAIPQ